MYIAATTYGIKQATKSNGGRYLPGSVVQHCG